MSSFRATRNSKILVLFDVDGTLTEPREEASEEMTKFLADLRGKVVTGIVGGSDLPKQQEQVGKNVVNEVDYSFSENGLVAYKDGALIGKQSIAAHLGEENLKEVIKFALHYIADIEIPVKR
jgi:phosphomannomutase